MKLADIRINCATGKEEEEPVNPLPQQTLDEVFTLSKQAQVLRPREEESSPMSAYLKPVSLIQGGGGAKVDFSQTQHH